MDSDISMNKSIVGNTTENNFHMSAGVERTALISINLTLAFTGTLGNFLIIFAFLVTPGLRRQVSNFYILSLAFADLIMTMIAAPLFVVNLMLFYRCSSHFYLMTIVLQMVGRLSILSSVFHLTSISIDRVVCTMKPCQYRFIKKRRSKVMLGASWGSAAAICFFSYLSQHIFTTQLPHITSITRVAIHLLGFAIMIVSYSTVLYKIKSNGIVLGPPDSFAVVRKRSMENRESTTIAIVILLFFACWVPGIIHFLVQKELDWCGLVIQNNFVWFHTVTLANSSMNVLVYSLRMQRFRVACRRILMAVLFKLRQAATCCCM